MSIEETRPEENDLLDKIGTIMHNSPFALYTKQSAMLEILTNAVIAARHAGFVVNISQCSTRPPITGRTVDVISIRPARKPGCDSDNLHEQYAKVGERTVTVDINDYDSSQ